MKNKFASNTNLSEKNYWAKQILKCGVILSEILGKCYVFLGEVKGKLTVFVSGSETFVGKFESVSRSFYM